MFRTTSLLQQQLKRSSSLVAAGAVLGAGFMASESQQEDTCNKNQFEGLTGSYAAVAAFPSVLQPSVALCDASRFTLARRSTVRQLRDKEVGMIRDMLLENPDLKPMKYKKGHIVHREGEISNGLCIVLDGEISLSTGRLSVSRKHKGDIFGALPLVMENYGARRFTARCISPECTIVEIGQEDFDKAIEAHPDLRKRLRDICLCQEFQRLVVLHTKKHFPKTPDGIRSLFHSIRYSPGIELQLLDVKRVIRSMDRKKSDEDIETIFAAMDVDGNGGLSVDEFEAIFYEI